MIERAVTVTVEAAHRDSSGGMHGHSYLVECWTFAELDLPEFERTVRHYAAHPDHSVLNESIGAPTMEALAAWFLEHPMLIYLSRVVVRRPTLGFTVEVRRV